MYPDSFEKMLAECAALGVPFAVASGRTLPSLYGIFGKFADRLLYFALDGALCAAGQTRLAAFPIPPEVVARTLESSSDCLGIELCAASRSYLFSKSPFLRESEQRRLKDEYAELGSSLPDEPIYKLILFNRRSEAPRICDSLHVVYRSDTVTELVRADVDKASAAAVICNALGIPAGEVVAFGDSENDRSLLRFAGTPITVYGAKHDIFSLSHKHTHNVAECVRLLLKEQLR